MPVIRFFPVLILLCAVAVSAAPAVERDPGTVMAAADTGTAALALMLQDAPSQPNRDYKVEVDVNRGGGAWYANPVWIAIGVLALLVLVLLIVMAARGRTTVVR